MKRVLAHVLAFSLFALLPARVALAQCSKDTECKGDRICNAGVCEAPRAAAPTPAPLPPPVVAVPARAFSEPAPEPTQYRRNSTGMMVTGIVVSSLGVASLATALALGITTVDCKNKLDDETLPESQRSDVETCRGYSTAADVTVISGLVLTGAGIPLLVIGARKVPVEPAVALSPWLSPQAAGVRLFISL